jgi:hypothetical protein
MKNLENYHTWGTPQNLSEGFGSAPDFHYETKIGSPSQNPGNLYLSLFKTPAEWGQDVTVDAGHVKWHVEIKHLNGGFDIENVIIDEIKLVIMSMEDAEDGIEHNFTMEISYDQLDPLKIKYSIDSLPFIMNDLDITMNGSEDPHDWNIDITLGVYE